MKFVAVTVLYLAWIRADECLGARILAMFHFPGGSHFNTLGTLTRELAARGHHVTVVSHCPLEDPPANYTDISIAGSSPSLTGAMKADALAFAVTEETGLTDMIKLLSFIRAIFLNYLEKCRAGFESPVMRKLIEDIRSGEKQFDLLITHALFSDCFDAFVHPLGNVPLVTVSTSMLTSWVSDRMANPFNPAYVPTFFLNTEYGNMNFYRRLVNTVYHIAIKWLRYWTLNAAIEELHKRHLGPDLPALKDTVSTTRVALINSHWSLGGALPLLPSVREIGGIHIKKPQPLPEDLESYLSGAEHGAVLLSMGSLVALHTIPEDKMTAILEPLSRLKQRVLFKCDASKLPASVVFPPNVRPAAWVPQTAVLAHPNTRLFISHGGMHSVMEAAHFGVPLLGMAFVADQKLNLNRMQRLGVALDVDYPHLSLHSFETALTTLINDSRYHTRAKQLSVLFRDRPRPPLEEAVYWVEYVLRHNGAPHLRSAAMDLAWYQYLLIDVVAVVLICLLLVIALLYLCVRAVLLCVSSNTRKLKSL